MISHWRRHTQDWLTGITPGGLSTDGSQIEMPSWSHAGRCHQSMHRDSCSHTTKVRTPADWARSSHFRNKSCRDYLNPYNAHTVSRADSPRISLTSHSFLAVYYRAWHPIFSFILPSVSPSLLSLSLQPERCICTVKAETLASAAPNSVACVNGSAASRLGHLESPSARLAHWHVSLAC
jgi:hypothetical protein